MHTIPHTDNFCGGNFQDWLEVMLTPHCNGRCEWCVEKQGWHPDNKTDHITLAKNIIAAGSKNVILLGGEPTLYPDLSSLILYLNDAGHNVYITTNGSRLNKKFAEETLQYLHGINISIHSFDLIENHIITGININKNDLLAAINSLKSAGCKVRLNCNLIKNYIDSKNKINESIMFAQELGAESVRFAELKNDINKFVSLYDIYGEKYGLNDDPFLKGCNKNTVISGMPINFRQMCGWQIECRPTHPNPLQVQKRVMYYDGIVYDGWQIKKEQEDMKIDRKDLIDILNKLKSKQYSIEQAADIIEECVNYDISIAMSEEEKESKKAARCIGPDCRY